MEACASPGFYFEVSPTQGISEAMTALFQKAISDARISSKYLGLRSTAEQS